MKAAIVVATLLSLASVAVAQEAEVPQIAVTGEAAISTVPDLALIDGGVTTEAKTAREASETNNAVMGKMLLALKSGGIPEKDLQTQRLSLQPQYTQRSNGAASVVTGYRASNRVTIKLRDMTQVAVTIDQLVSAGANDIGGVTFTVAEPSKLLDDARVQAMADARRKAEIYAKAAGVELGAPLAISEQGPAPPAMMRRMAGGFAAQSPTPTAQGEETLRVSVSVSWGIKGAK